MVDILKGMKMSKTQDRIWFKNDRSGISAALSFDARQDCLKVASIPFDQTLEIREQLKDEIFRQMFGHMPRTCTTVMRHLKSVEQELRQMGQTQLANRLSSSRALVDSIRDQMEVHRPAFDPFLTQEDDSSANS
jgi:hypothetical protein